MSDARVRRGPFLVAAGGFALLALFLPAESLVEVLGRRINTVRGFRSDYLRGMALLRVALGFAAAVLAALPLLLDRARLVHRRPGPLFDVADRGPAVALWLLALLAAATGLGHSFQDDEYRCLVAYIVHGPGILLTRSGADSHLLQGLLSWIPVKLLGPTEVAVRLPSLLLGSLSPSLVFHFLRRAHPVRIAFLASLPAAAWPFLAQYTAEGRGYAPLVAAMLVLVLLLPAVRDGVRPAWIGAVAASAACVGFHLFAAPVVTALLLAPMADRTHRNRCVAARLGSVLLVAGAVSFLAYAPVLPQGRDYAASVAGDPAAGLGDHVRGFLGALAWPGPVGLAAAPLLLAGSTKSGPGALVLAGSVVLQGLLVWVTGAEPASRFYLPSATLLLLAALSGLASLLERVPRAGVAVLGAWLAVSAAGLAIHASGGRRDYRRAAFELQARRAPGEDVAGLFDARPLAGYGIRDLAILTPAELQARRPAWIVGVGLNFDAVPGLRAVLEAEYDPQFRLPSLRGELQGYRRRAR